MPIHAGVFGSVFNGGVRISNTTKIISCSDLGGWEDATGREDQPLTRNDCTSADLIGPQSNGQAYVAAHARSADDRLDEAKHVDYLADATDVSILGVVVATGDLRLGWETSPVAREVKRRHAAP